MKRSLRDEPTESFVGYRLKPAAGEIKAGCPPESDDTLQEAVTAYMGGPSSEPWPLASLFTKGTTRPRGPWSNGNGIVRNRDAGIANKYFGACDEFINILVGSAAEGAGKVATLIARTPNALPPASAGRIDDLLHPLMAQLQRSSDFSQGRSGQMHPSNDAVILGAGFLNFLFRLRQACAAMKRFR